MSLAATDPVAAAKQCLDSGRIEEARDLLASVLDREPRHLVARCVAGYAAFVTGDFAGARPHLELAIDVDPLAFDAQYLHAFTLVELGEAAAAEEALARVLALKPECAPARALRARLMLARGDAGAARLCLDAGRAHGFPDEEIAALLAGPEAAAPEAAPAFELPRIGRSDSGSAWVDPRELLHPRRLDVCVKLLQARALLGHAAVDSGYPAEDAYLRHIQFRTGGAEPGDRARKGSLADFALQFAQLVQDMRRRGFDPAHPIPVARRTGLLLNGAHRLAAALALGIERIPVVYDDDLDGLTWDFDELVDQGFRPAELDEILRAWIDVRGPRAACVTLWPPVEKHWDELERDIATRFPRVASRDREFTAERFGELVRDLYTTDWGPVPGENIERKVELFAAYAPRLRLMVVEVPRGEDLGSLKRTMRERYQAVVPADRFATLHTTDTPAETANAAGLLLHGPSLAALRRRPRPAPRFLEWLAQYRAALDRLKIDPEHCCVVGSAVLEALGVRPATDIDFTVTHAVREARFTPGVTHVTPGLDVVARDYPRAIARPAAPDDDALVLDRALHFRYRGLKFASLDVVLERKQTQRRPKDLADVARVARMRLAGAL